MYNYRRHVNNYFPRRPVNNYFLYTTSNPNRSKNARFEGITRDDHDGMPLHV